MKKKYKRRQKKEYSMVIIELEDGRKKIMSKNHKPDKYNLLDRKDLDFLEDYYRNFIDEKAMGYTKDFKWIVPPSDPEIIYAKSYRIEPYKDAYVPERTFTLMGNKDIDYNLSYEKIKEIRNRIWNQNTGE